jgi:hypothetical protein
MASTTRRQFFRRTALAVAALYASPLKALLTRSLSLTAVGASLRPIRLQSILPRKRPLARLPDNSDAVRSSRVELVREDRRARILD